MSVKWSSLSFLEMRSLKQGAMPKPDLGQASWVHPPWEDKVMEREQDAEEGPKGRMKSGWLKGKTGHRADPG